MYHQSQEHKSILSMCHYQSFFSYVPSQINSQHVSLQVVPHPCVTPSCSSSMCYNKSFFICHLKSVLSICHSKLFLIHVSLQVVPHPCITTSHSSFMSPQVSPQHVSLQDIPHPLSKLSLIYGRNGVKLVITMLATQ